MVVDDLVVGIIVLAIVTALAMVMFEAVGTASIFIGG
jgi:hypothetical protein